MTSSTRRGSVVVAAVAAVVVGLGAFAWACVPSSHLWAEPDFGVPGAAMRVEGRGFAGAHVELRWGALDGPVLSTVAAPDFTATFPVPATTDGVYAVYAVARASDGTSPSWNRTPFEVTASGVRGTWADGGWQQRPQTNAEPVPAPAPAPQLATAPASQPALSPAPQPVATPTPDPVPERSSDARPPTPGASPRVAAGAPSASPPALATAPTPAVQPNQPAPTADPLVVPTTLFAPDGTVTPAPAGPRVAPGTSEQRRSESDLPVGAVLAAVGVALLVGGLAAARIPRTRPAPARATRTR